MDATTFESSPRSASYLPSPALKENGFPSEKDNEKTSTHLDIVSTINTDDPFPVDPDAPVEEHQFTFRAAIVGCALGAVIAASNTGWTFGASLFGAIFGFAILKPLSTSLPRHLGGAATSAGSLGLLLNSGFPAAYQLGLLQASPSQDIGRLFTFTICCAFFGPAFSIPLRKFYILKLKLVFPTGVAAAYTIQSLHVGKNAVVEASKKTRALILSFCFAITLRVVSEYAPALLGDWHIFYTLNRIGWTSAIAAESWEWIWEWTPAFIGVGMLTGINASYSFLGGVLFSRTFSFLAWAIISRGMASGIPADDSIPSYVWPGTIMLLCTSFAKVTCNARSIYMALRGVVLSVADKLQRLPSGDRTKEAIFDPVPENKRVPLWMWGSVLLASIIISCVVMGVQFGQNVGVTLLAILFAFLFSFIGTESCGRTNITPVTAIGNASQLVFGGVGKGNNYSPKQNELLNSLSGMLALATDMIVDLKAAHLLRSSPKAGFYAQLCVVSIFISAGVYVVFSSAYPYINSLSYDTCSFPIPDVQVWRAIAVAVSSSTLPIPPSSGYTAIGLGVASILSVVVKYKLVPPKYHAFVPNFNAMEIAFIMNVSTYPLAMFFGSTVAFFWRRG
ncbi:hypothetical protein OG21DRAFT_1477176 [Imleria badia]|nr:hypothetical protein OG21DRAFT_1477176 [Imleria badia]